MKIIKKISITLLAFSFAATLFMGCGNSSSPEKTESTTTEETTDTSDTDENTTEETTNAAGYIEPTLPPNVGNDPFKGKTERLS